MYLSKWYYLHIPKYISLYEKKTIYRLSLTICLYASQFNVGTTCQS